MEARRIAEWEHDRSVYMSCHFSDYLFSEGFGFRRCTYEDVRFGVLNYRKKVIMLAALPIAIFAGKWYLSRSQISPLRL